MIPLRVVAELSSAPIFGGGPLMLDAPLLFAWGRRAGRAAGGVRVSDEDVIADFERRAPLARVEGPDGLWWWACSQVTPEGPEERKHLHRRVSLPQVARWTDARTVNLAVGADKSLRMPVYSRPHQLSMAWTCIGDADTIRDLLRLVDSVGKHGSRGAGWVRRWTVEPDPAGPPLSAYARDLTLRHLPSRLVETDDLERASALGFTASSDHALRAPYWMRTRERTTRCFQLSAIESEVW